MMSKSQTNLMALALAEDFSTPNTSSKVDNTSEKLEASSIDNKTGASSIESVAKKSNRGYKGDIYEYDVMKNPTNKLDVGTELGFAKKVEDQAQRLGITNSKYNWIAEKSLTANLELPPEWSENETEDGFKFYFNSDTGESVWDHPGLSYFKDMYAQMVAADAEEKLDPATPIKTAWKPKEDSDDEHSSNSDSSSTSGDEEVITRKVATELTDKFVKEDAMYWHSQYDSLLVEKNRLDRQLERMESVLSKSVGEQSKLHDEKYRLHIANEDSVVKLGEVADKALAYLYKRGFHSSGKLRKHLVDEEMFIPTLDTACADLSVIFDLYIKCMQDNAVFDDAGYSKSWSGVAKRLSEELSSCFVYDENQTHVRTDALSLQHYLEELSQILCTFGEYLPDNSMRAEYIEKLMKHITHFAPADTMVPLEFVNNIMSKEAASDNNESLYSKPVDLQAPYIDMPPSAVMKMKKDLIVHTTTISELEDQVYRKNNEIEILVAKLDAANVRLSERQLFDENVNNKFNALTKELSELKLIQSINDTREIDSHTSVDDKENVRHKKISLADEIKMLKEKIANMEEELEVSNKRADENEARTEKIVHENEQIKRVHKNTEVNYQLTITKLRNRCQELREANSEQKEVAEGIYKELNKTLVLCASLERDRNEMKMQLELMKGGESNIQKLKDALGDENRRVLALEKECENLRHEIHILQGNISLLVDKNKQAKEVSEQIQKNLIEKSHDAKRYLQNLDKVEEEKRNLANSLVSLRRNYMKISDRLIDVQGNIRIFCRVRPLLEAEFTQHYNEAKQSHTLAHATSVAAVRELNSMIKYIDYDTLEFDQHLYKYDRIFTPDENQEEVYDEVESIVRAAISGNNCCIFAYGQTGSGKTHTMIGPPDNRGVNMRSFETIFANANDEYRETGTQTVVNMSMLQVYNERIIDLLVNKPQSHMEPSNLDSLHIRQRQGGEVYVEGLTEYVVKNEKEVSTLLSLGGSNLMVASNNINEYSSRSHLVIDVKIQRTNPQTRQNTIGHLHLIDLAGSERVKTTEATGSRLREAQYINKSLSALSDVVYALTQQHKHVPYRNSKLTYLLQDSLKVNSSKVLMFANISPAPALKHESIATLQFASKCRSVMLGHAKKNIGYSE